MNIVGNKTKLKRKLRTFINKGLSTSLFRNKEWTKGARIDIHSFGDGSDVEGSYIYFLDNVSSLEELNQGLEELSPFADDALEVTKSMSERDFCDFKLALPAERDGKDGHMPEQFVSLLLPTRLLKAMFLSQKAAAPLGTTLIRMLEVELEQNSDKAKALLEEIEKMEK